MRKRPGGELATRPLHFIWILDGSGSMSIDGKIQALNNAIREAIPHMRQVADENPNANVLVRALVFSSGVRWHVSQPTSVRDFEWEDLKPEGVTDMGAAFHAIAETLRIPPMTERALPPVLVLVSDGQSSDDMTEGLNEMMRQPWGKKSVRLAIGIGEDVDLEALQQFIGNAEYKPLQANNPEALVKYIQFVSTAALQAASSPFVGVGTNELKSNVPMPKIAVEVVDIDSAMDIW